jgi:hypothetical protein
LASFRWPLVLMVLWLVACTDPNRLRVGLRAEEGANGNAPVAVAVLVVYDDVVFAELSKLSASEWFQQSEQYQKDNPNMVSFDLLSWELMPGQEVKESVVPLQERPSKGLVFADYYANGRHRARFRPARRILVLLGKQGFDVVDLEDADD